MASFSVSINALDSTTAMLDGNFSGGDPNYIGYRFISLNIDDRILTINSSSNAGGANCSFSYIITGLSPNTEYDWDATLGYYVEDE